jgi:hypothetical protein
MLQAPQCRAALAQKMAMTEVALPALLFSAAFPTGWSSPAPPAARSGRYPRRLVVRKQAHEVVVAAAAAGVLAAVVRIAVALAAAAAAAAAAHV